MEHDQYEWKRFWLPRADQASLSDGGYLTDPDTSWGRYTNPNAVALDTLANISCLILLGEPGSGKTTALAMEYERCERQHSETSDAILWFDLNKYQSDIRLETKLFDHPVVQLWRAGSHTLHLYLDSLDECLLRIPTTADLLAEDLGHLPCGRLHLHLACRSADWPIGFEKQLRQLWGTDNVGVYTLAPLRKNDVARAAHACAIDARAFLAAVARAAAIPLAIKPITLELLLNNYIRSGSLPKTQRELYERGCEQLCTETNEHRHETRLLGDSSVQERLTIAERIAAITIFANRYAFWTRLDREDAPKADITMRELLGFQRLGQEIREPVVREILSTGLFSALSLHEVGWAHHTFAEFLAARFVANRMSARQVMSLLTHAGDPGGKVIPQLRDVAAWIASMMPEVFSFLVQTDPDVLLRGDVAALDADARKHLVSALLAFYDAESALDRDPALRRQYAALSHSGLADQLRPYIVDNTKGTIVRRVAIEIAEACGLSRLQDELLRIALDPIQPVHIRRLAADAVTKIGDDSGRLALRPLVFGLVGDDPDDDLRGAGLRALWPLHLTASELFDALTPPQNESYYGPYADFLHSKFVSQLRPSDLPVALAWAERQASSTAGDRLRVVVDKLLMMTWTHMDVPAAAEALARAALTRISRHQPLVDINADNLESEDSEYESGHQSPAVFVSQLRTDEVRRKRLFETMLPILIEKEIAPVMLAYSSTPIILPSDMPWLIKRLHDEQSADVARILAQLIADIADLNDPDQLDAILVACSDLSILAEKFRWLLTPVHLNSPEAERMRKQYQEDQELATRRLESRTSSMLQAEIDRQITDYLEQCESGDSAAWWRLNMALAVTSAGLLHGAEFEPDIIKLPGWKSAGAAIQERLIEAARRYVIEQDPQALGWLTPSNLRLWMGSKLYIHRPAYAGYRALLLLQRNAPEVIAALESNIWRRWAPILVTFPWQQNDDIQAIHDDLMQLAYQHAADEIIATFLAQIKQQNREIDFLHGLHRVEACWDDRFSDAVLAAIQHRRFRATILQLLLAGLIERGSVKARMYAQRLIKRRMLGVNAHEQAIVAASTLLTHADDAGWPIVWPVFEQDSVFGREVVLNLHRVPSGNGLLASRLMNVQVADLFIWLASVFPPDGDPLLPHGMVSDEQHVVMWRNSLITHLQQRRTPEALDELRRVLRSYPQYDWLQWQLQEAEELVRHDTWQPVSPEVIFKLAESHKHRLVESGEQLLDVIVESLDRLQEELQGETSAAAFLWNEAMKQGRKTFTPRDENTLSDYVKLHLDRDLRQRGIVANREVEIRRGQGGAGERTDIQVDALVPGSELGHFDTMSVIIEVKGCWHREVLKAMESQLVERYLSDNQCRYGLYLVGWYYCPQWDDGDTRKRDMPRLSLQAARQQFTTQAADLSERPGQHMQVRAVVLNTALR